MHGGMRATQTISTGHAGLKLTALSMHLISPVKRRYRERKSSK
jgi:hypothetical protein